MAKKRVLFLIHDLGGGGAERVLVNLVNHMNSEKYDISVKTVFRGGVNQKLLNQHIHYECLNAIPFPGSSVVYKFFPARLLYRHFIGEEQYDLLIAYRSGIPTKIISGCKDKRVGLITWLHHGNSGNSLYFTPWMRRKNAIKAYSRMDAVACVAQKAADSFTNYTGIQDKTVVILNTNDTDRIYQLIEQGITTRDAQDESIHLITVGRLIPVKGFDRLLRVISRLVIDGYPVKLTIVGEGEERNNLENMIKEMHLDEIVNLYGFTENPYAIIARSDLFICSSVEEGLSTAVTESIISGTPVISTDVSGAYEILGANNEYGVVVVNSEDGIYHGIKELLDDPKLMKRYKELTIQRAKQFSTEAIVADTETFFDRIIEAHAG